MKIKKRIDFDYIVGDKVLILKDGILRKSESPKQKITMDYNTSSYEWNNQGSRGTESEWLNVQRVEPFFEKEE